LIGAAETVAAVNKTAQKYSAAMIRSWKLAIKAKDADEGSERNVE
jgi:hypothetical protein